MPAARILREDQSTSTDENLRFTRQLLNNRGVDAAALRIAIVTSDFHAARAGRLAHHSGFARSWIVTAPTPASILLNVWLREYLAWGKGWLMGEF